MTVVSLTNAGLIPIEAVTTMGVSAKEGESPIGFFGTGLKYAVAGLLRMGHRITIFRGLDRYDFASEKGEVRGKEFDFIRMTGPDGDARLGFTTHLGAKWEMWQVFRELYSNCLDEGGQIAFAAVDPAEGQTTIWVTGEQFAESARGKDRLFLSTRPIFSGPFVDIHPNPSNAIYYRGVMAASLERHSRFTYNIKTTTDLTEDRTIKHRYMADCWVAHTLTHCDDPAIVEKAITHLEGYEGALDLSRMEAAGAEIVLEVCERRGIADVLPTARRGAEEWAQREARVKEIAPSPREVAEIEAAKSFLAQIGYPVTAPIIFTETLGAGVFGMAKDGRIYIARVTLNRGGNFLIGTLLEEHLHLTHGFRDESRRFQDFLIDMVVKFARDAIHAGLSSVAPCPPEVIEAPIPILIPAPVTASREPVLDEVPF